MLCIRFTIDHIWPNTSCSGNVITPSDVRTAIAHIKSGKGDGYDGVCSDHFIIEITRLYVYLPIIFT